ncbi:hypothetical protein HNY73_006921 [Argiope bruennichi]|uniref:Uncharacterized protein n=1 Tax=Argiope bruennichi TaxID=94029 RepID=A0A8T0FJG2_ARGBR|nr:hypothetical protein HNY73_006921 [Argiope bruennichi]
MKCNFLPRHITSDDLFLEIRRVPACPHDLDRAIFAPSFDIRSAARSFPPGILPRTSTGPRVVSGVANRGNKRVPGTPP